MVVDPLAEVVALLQPGRGSRRPSSARAPGTIRRSDAGQPFYCVVLEGGCRLVVRRRTRRSSCARATSSWSRGAWRRDVEPRAAIPVARRDAFLSR